MFIEISEEKCFNGEIPSNCKIIKTCSNTRMCEIKCSSVDTECLCVGDPCCTLSQGGWENSKKGCKSHPVECNETLCNRTYIEILEDNSINNNAWLILAHQWIPSVLNIIVNNACTVSIVNTTLFDSNISLTDNCDDQYVSIYSFNGMVMNEQATILKQFNTGNLGVENC